MAGIFLASSLLACLVMATLLQPMDLANQEMDLANKEMDLANEEEETSQNLADKSNEGISSKMRIEVETRRESLPRTKQLLITATVRQMTNRDQLLLIPLTLWCGVEQGFFGADFTAVGTLFFDKTLPAYLPTYPCQPFLKRQAQLSLIPYFPQNCPHGFLHLSLKYIF